MTNSVSPLVPRVAPATGLAVLSGFLYFLAFPGVNCWPLGIVAWIPLWIALQGQTPKRGLALGWVAGFVMTMAGFSWLLEMLRVFSGFSTPWCVFFMAVICAYQAGRIALMGYLYCRCATSRGLPRYAAFLAAFVSSELLFPLLFPWYFGVVALPTTWLPQIADVCGPIGVGLVVCCANLGLAEPLLARWERRPVAWRVLAGCALPVFVALGYGAVRVRQTDALVAQAPVARAGLVQANMSLLGKREDRLEGLRRHVAATRELNAKTPLDLVIWSETSVMGGILEEHAEALIAARFSRQLGVPTLFGAELVRPVNDARRYTYFNSALLTDRSGALVGRYDKQYLLAFGEYLPFGETFPVLYEISENSGRFSAGSSFEPLRFEGHAISTLVCYEDLLPSFVRKLVDQGNPDLLVNITNDAWFGDSSEPWIHLALARFRAIEHRRYFLRGTNSGVSAIIDPNGRVRAHTGTFREQAITGEFAWLRAHTAYEFLGDAPWWAVAGLTLLVAFLPRKAVRLKSALN